MVIENAYALEEIKLGRRGENQARKVVFDVLGKWREGYGDGVASLIVQRNGDAQPYPVTVTEEDGALVWLVSSVDTAVAGEGAAELRYTVGDTIVKSQIYKTHVRETLEDSGETPPAAYQSWVDEVLQAAADAETAVSKMPYVDETTGNWFKWDATAGAFVDTGVAATGPQGEVGPKGATGAQGPKGETGATGATGPQGPAGPANVLTIGSVTSGKVASATITGEAPNQVLNLVLEKGDKGDTGEQGPKGETGATGPTGPEGPRGPQGEPGPPGKDGITPEIVEGELVPVPSAGGGTDTSLGITGAQVGQIAKITAVDTDGKPTAWEPVDMAGGDNTFKKVVEMTTLEDAAVISIGTDKNGNPLSMSEFYVAITTARNNAATANNNFECNVLPDTVPTYIRSASAIKSLTLYQDVYCYVMHYKVVGGMIFVEYVGRKRTASGLDVAEYLENLHKISVIPAVNINESITGFLLSSSASNGVSKTDSSGKMYCITFDANNAECIFGAGTRVEVWAK